MFLFPIMEQFHVLPYHDRWRQSQFKDEENMNFPCQLLANMAQTTCSVTPGEKVKCREHVTQIRGQGTVNVVDRYLAKVLFDASTEPQFFT